MTDPEHQNKCRCGKTLYKKRKEADVIVKWKLTHKGIHLRVYRCPNEYGWHLTSKAKWDIYPPEEIDD